MESRLRSLIIPSQGLNGLVILCAKPGTSIASGGNGVLLLVWLLLKCRVEEDRKRLSALGEGKGEERVRCPASLRRSQLSSLSPGWCGYSGASAKSSRARTAQWAASCKKRQGSLCRERVNTPACSRWSLSASSTFAAQRLRASKEPHGATSVRTLTAPGSYVCMLVCRCGTVEHE